MPRHHRNLLRDCGKRFGEAGDSELLDCTWSYMRKRPESGFGNDNMATYLCTNRVRHLSAADCVDAAEPTVGFTGVVALLFF